MRMAGILLGAMALLALEANPAEAGRRGCRLWNYGCGYQSCIDDCSCDPCGPVCETAYQDVECTVMVPETCYETRKITTTQYTHETRQRPVTYYEQVPRVVTRKVNYTVCDPVVKERTVPYCVSRPVYEDRQVPYHYCEPVYEQRVGHRPVVRHVWEEVPYNYTVMVPRTVWHTAVRKVCHMEQVTKMRTICVDQGCWVEHVVQTPCCPAPTCGNGCGNGCGNACGCAVSCCRPVTCRVWKPCIVEKQVPYTVCRPVYVDQEYKYCTTVCDPEVRTATRRVCRAITENQEFTYTVCRMVHKQATRTVRVCRYVQETHQRVERYTVMVPRVVTRDEQYTVYDCVPRQRMENYTVCVPVCVEKEIQVPVCRMVAKTVVKRVPVPCNTCCETPACGCGPACGNGPACSTCN